MPEKKTLKKARKAMRQGKAPTTQAGAFVEEEFHHLREGKHGASSPEQAVAIGLSKARRSGVKLPAPKKGSARTRKKVSQDLAKGRKTRRAGTAARKKTASRARPTTAGTVRRSKGRTSAAKTSTSRPRRAGTSTRRGTSASRGTSTSRGTTHRSTSRSRASKAA